VKGIDADEVPSIQTAGERPTTRVNQGILRRALEETIFAAASDEARPILTGVLARFEGDKVTFAAADNYRIAVKTISTLDPVEETASSSGSRAGRGGPSSATSTTRSSWCWPRPATRSCSTSRGRPGQPPDRRPIPQLPPGPAVGSHDPGRGRPGRALKAVRPAALDRELSANIIKLAVGVGTEAG
jgi:hypothetical protein